MKILALTAVALLVAAPAFAVTKVNSVDEAARIAFERGDAWHIKHLGLATVPPQAIIEAPAAGAVPEPASWAMMVAGFGLIGGTLRRRSMDRVAA